MKIPFINRLLKGAKDSISINTKGNKEDTEDTPVGEIDKVRLWSAKITRILVPLLATGLLTSIFGEEVQIIIQSITDFLIKIIPLLPA